jgi:uncharacterized membrane protein (UPF0127 family)
MLPRRLRRLPSHDIGGGLTVLEARGFRARLLGLAFVRKLPVGHALLIPRCSSIHTFGMRFRIDLVFLSADEVLRVDRDVPPGRIRRCAGARAVLELESARSQPQDRLQLFDGREVLGSTRSALHGDQVVDRCGQDDEVADVVSLRPSTHELVARRSGRGA